MIFEQFYLESLGHASYLVGDEKTDRALLLDPRRDVDVYLESARMHGLRIAYAIDLWEPPALVPSEFRRHREAGAVVVETLPTLDVHELRGRIEASLLAPMRPGRVLSVAGGMSAWTTSGYPIVA